MSSDESFDFAFERRFIGPARLFGITASTTSLRLNRDELRARFGPWLLVTPRSNILRATITGPYRYFKTVGPARLSLRDGGISFATNSRAGVQIDFRTPVPGIEPSGRLRHPNLTATVTDYATLAAIINFESESESESER